jgi:hypothetical protein
MFHLIILVIDLSIIWRVELTLMSPMDSRRLLEETVVPSLDLVTRLKNSFDEDACFDFLEWTGLAIADKLHAWTIMKDPFISTMKPSELYTSHSTMTRIGIRGGIFGDKETRLMLTQLQNHLMGSEGRLAWIVVVFHGFREVPLLDPTICRDEVILLCPERSQVAFQCLLGELERTHEILH